MILISIELIILTSISLIYDLKEGKIKNKIVLFFLSAGMIQMIYIKGISGLIFSAVGILIPLLILYPLYALGMTGAGDVKIFCTTGAMAGPVFSLWSILFSYLAGGIISVVIIIRKKNSREKLANIRSYFLDCFAYMKILPYKQLYPDRFPFMTAIFPGTILTLILMCLKKLNCLIG